MSIIYSGTTIDTIIYSGTTLDNVYYGSTLVYTRDTNTYIFKNGTLGSGVTLAGGTISNDHITVSTLNGKTTTRCDFYFPNNAIPSGTRIYVYANTTIAINTKLTAYLRFNYSSKALYSLSLASTGYHTVNAASSYISNYTSIELYISTSSDLTVNGSFDVYKVYYE